MFVFFSLGYEVVVLPWGIVLLPGWLPDNTGIQWEKSNYGGRGTSLNML